MTVMDPTVFMQLREDPDEKNLRQDSNPKEIRRPLTPVVHGRGHSVQEPALCSLVVSLCPLQVSTKTGDGTV